MKQGHGREGGGGELTGLAEVLRKVLNLLGGAEGQLVIVKLQKDGCSFRQGQWRQVGFRRWGGYVIVGCEFESGGGWGWVTWRGVSVLTSVCTLILTLSPSLRWWRGSGLVFDFDG